LKLLVASFQNVSAHYGAQTVLQDVTFKINSGEKIGLIGNNGTGKTTILRVMLGRELPTGGTVVIPDGVRVGYVPQYVEYDDDATVIDALLEDYHHASDNLREQEERLANAPESDIDRVMRSYQKALDRYDRIDGETFPRRAQAMLDALGLKDKENQRTGSLSGGEKNVLSLAEALLAQPDLLVLDEPANHLDYAGVAWLEDFLRRFRGAVLIVSHNRYLLDRVVSGIMHLENGRIHQYEGSYSTFRATRLQELISQQADYIVNQKRLAQLEALVKRFEQIARATADPAWGKRLRARKSQLEREKKQAVDKPILDQSAIKANFRTEVTRSNIALQIRGYSKAFGGLTLFENTDMDIGGGERVALVGPNGSGKTTLVRDIVERGDWGDDVIRVGPSMRVGYSSQEQEVLDKDRTIIEEIMVSSPSPMSSNDAFALLTRFLFVHEDMRKRVSQLSGGERNRLQLARLMVMKVNFLILDEPTNHLDISAQEAVEEALEDFQGTMLVVSHDRYFLDKVVDRVVEIRDKELVSFDGNFSEFWRERHLSTASAVGRVSTRAKQREKPRVQRAAQRQATADLERRIRETEEQKLMLEKQLVEAFNTRKIREGRRLERQLARVTSELDDLFETWAESDE
jgi:ATP-binding cassette subfamily F protein 3